MRILLIFIILLLANFPLPAQTTQVQQGRNVPVQQKQMQQRNEAQLIADRARRTEDRGDYQGALQMWQDLLSKSMWNAEAILGISRDMIVLKKYDDVEVFLKEQIRKSNYREPRVTQIEDPTSVYALTLRLGEVALARGKRDQAWQIWNEALTRQNKSGGAVRLLVGILQANRLWEDGDNLIREYRKTSKDAIFMALESANSLRAQMNFAAATEELLLYSRTSPSSWSIVINYLDRFPDDTTVIKKVNDVLDKAIKTDRKNPDLWRILAAYKLKAGELEKSLNATITADSLADGTGSLVLSSAQVLLKEDAIALARRGFERCLKFNPSPEIEERAEIGLAECLETQGQWTQAKQAYEGFMLKHSKSRALDEVKFRIANIQLAHEKQPDQAMALYKELWGKLSIPWRTNVGLRIGDCYVWMDDYASAIKSWREVVRFSSQKQLTEDGAQAFFRMARANFWRDSINAAMDILDSIMEGNPTSSTFNDAVLYSALLDEGGVYKAVRAFASGDLGMFKNDYLSAAENYATAADLLKSSKVAEWCRYQQAIALRAAGKPSEAIAALDTFIASYPTSVDLDRSVYMRAVIRLEDLNEDAAALEALQKFLIDYPRSPYLEQARRKARILSARVS